jgi:hypothetical protein
VILHISAALCDESVPFLDITVRCVVSIPSIRRVPSTKPSLHGLRNPISYSFPDVEIRKSLCFFLFIAMNLPFASDSLLY